eukprot:CAMPEP_0202059976 /NCGR_PEP_ID=MMETSP0963-20130614/36706_1 /ASSEMBLY_ACC=CAM_ASM_000494 /TAXON_ID=4773 /ORGANISM="Schizochytrium aggregatum, Strain ATCC28209" /LENGTH=99 /DNA_ID=CAMNT_0048626053 /DNA_START=67 /DNA_END=366 /DNA_ORIENTATION=-
MSNGNCVFRLGSVMKVGQQLVGRVKFEGAVRDRDFGPVRVLEVRHKDECWGVTNVLGRFRGEGEGERPALWERVKGEHLRGSMRPHRVWAHSSLQSPAT